MLTRAVLPHMPAVGRGAIVSTASEASLRGASRAAAQGRLEARGGGADEVPRGDVPEAGHPHERHRPGGTSTGIAVDAEQGAHGPSTLARGAGGRGEQHQRRDPARRRRLVGRLTVTQPPRADVSVTHPPSTNRRASRSPSATAAAWLPKGETREPLKTM
nr:MULTISPECIES: hypothetical protein [Streptomyces]